jgi:hypothetical protein
MGEEKKPIIVTGEKEKMGCLEGAAEFRDRVKSAYPILDELEITGFS